MLRNPFVKRKISASSSISAGSDIMYDSGHQQKCTIRFLDDNLEQMMLPFKRDTTGQELMDELCRLLDLVEKDYFGLRFVDNEKQRHWLDLTKTVSKQLKNVKPMIMCFRVKFYPSEPSKVKFEQTRYYLFLQVRRDLHHGRLLCTQEEADMFAAYILQSDIGDYDATEHPVGYVASQRMLPKQCEGREEIITELHRTLTGQTPAVADLNFLSLAAKLDTYGVDPHPVKDQESLQIYLGVTHRGIITFHGSKRKLLYTWNQITKLTFEGKVFIVHVIISEKKEAFGFKCPTVAACKHLWKCAVEQRFFYTLQSTNDIPRVISGGGLFSRSSRFRFSGRCEVEAYNDPSRKEEPRFIRSTSNLNFINRRHKHQQFGSLPSPFQTLLGLSDSSASVDSYSQVDAVSRSNDGDVSILTSNDQHDHNANYDMDLSKTDDVDDRRVNDSGISSPDVVPSPVGTVSDVQSDSEIGSGDHLSGSSAVHESSTQPNGLLERCASPADKNKTGNNVEYRVPSANVVVMVAPPSRLLVFTWAVILAAFLLALTLLTLTVFVLESDTNLTLVSSIRRLPEVCEFRRELYAPWRDWFLRITRSSSEYADAWKC